MTLQKRLCVGVSALMCAASIAATAAADSPQPLSRTDAQAYAQAFDAADGGDFIGAQMQAAEIKDKSLLGYLSFRQLMHPTAHKASFDELAAWLAKFRDLPLAERIFSLAAKRKPAEAAGLPQPEIAGSVPADNDPRSGPDRSRPAREAFYSGDAGRAFELANAVGERWIAGMAAYRLKDYAAAEQAFGRLARDQDEDPWLRAAGGFWAARSATALGDPTAARGFLALAARSPETFYGMIADRQARLQAAQAQAPTGQLVLASYQAPDPDLAVFALANPRAHRAAALAQIGRLDEARQELRAGLTLAKAAEKPRWSALIAAMGQPAPRAPTRRYATPGDYPTPVLEPKWGFTIDKALVYAIVRQESRFDPMARSPVGAVGLMQLMPEAAARAAGDDKLKADMSPLLDPAFNLRVGQDYVTWLMERGVGYDILRTVAAYTGGPGTLLKTVQMVGEDDPLMIVESLPSVETRNYVEKVMAAYWTYQKKFGLESRTLDALATGQKYIDARWDAPLAAAKVEVAEDEDVKAPDVSDKKSRRSKRG